ncbi:DUF6285 domain-containing protein [Aminobacter sp. LjRoot7]|uniref:DUF6285 domain-containing protein n=1 Tax=Aminobacter sp. LjRoot7 TaxID=3342335 RepID=UPI003ECC9DC5
MLDRPSGDKLLEAVIRFLREELVPELDGAASFKTRVAANALDLVRREIAGKPPVAAAEGQRLAELLGHDGDLETLNAELCAAIRDGAVTLGTPGLSDHLWATTLDKLAIEQPTYATYRHVIEDRRKERTP